MDDNSNNLGKACISEEERTREMAQKLFPGGVNISSDGLSIDDQIRRTAETMQTAKVMFEAVFCYDGVIVKADIMRKRRNKWELYIVKNGKNSMDIYLLELAVQYYVIYGSGVTISRAYVKHLYPDYVRINGTIVEKLYFVTVNLTSRVEKMQAAVVRKFNRVTGRRRSPD